MRELRLELDAKAGLLGFIPDFCLSYVEFCTMTNLKLKRQGSVSRRFFTSAHEL